jgi:geranylgeranyl reductase family protein
MVSGVTDVVVVGAGPAGSVAALRLARAGARVTIVEKKPVPREKVCGDALIPDSLAVLEELGLHDRIVSTGQDSRGIRVYAPNGLFVDVEGRCVCIRRQRLDGMLVEAACDAGATLQAGTEAVSFMAAADAAEIGVRTGEGKVATLRARLVILASGASSKVLARFGLDHRSQPSALALRGYYRLRPDVPQDLLHIWYEKPVLPGYAWIFPMGDHVFNVGAGVFRQSRRRPPNLRILFERFRSECSVASDMLEDATPIGAPAGAPLRTNLEGCALTADRLLVVGEAAGSTFALSGEGIGKAMETAMIAARVGAEALHSDRLAEEDLAAYPEAVRSGLRAKFRHYATAQRWLRYPAVVNLVAWRVARSKALRALLSDVLNERRDPTELLSVRGLVRAGLAR